jgi:hypothetical protein
MTILILAIVAIAFAVLACFAANWSKDGVSLVTEFCDADCSRLAYNITVHSNRTVSATFADNEFIRMYDLPDVETLAAPMSDALVALEQIIAKEFGKDSSYYKTLFKPEPSKTYTVICNGEHHIFYDYFDARNYANDAVRTCLA